MYHLSIIFALNFCFEILWSFCCQRFPFTFSNDRLYMPLIAAGKYRYECLSGSQISNLNDIGCE